MARSKRKRCMVYSKHLEGGVSRCDGKIKPGTAFCKEHFQTHRVVFVKCNGEAHSNPYIDHCGVCMPFWGRYPVAVPKELASASIEGFLDEAPGYHETRGS